VIFDSRRRDRVNPFLQVCPYKKLRGYIRQRISTPNPLFLNMSHSAAARHLPVC